MGPHIDAAVNNQVPFRPNPMDFADMMFQWNPRQNPDAVSDIPPSGDFTIVPLDVTPDWNDRIDFDYHPGPRYRKLTGYAASVFVDHVLSWLTFPTPLFLSAPISPDLFWPVIIRPGRNRLGQLKNGLPV